MILMIMHYSGVQYFVPIYIYIYVISHMCIYIYIHIDINMCIYTYIYIGARGGHARLRVQRRGQGRGAAGMIYVGI